MAKKVKIPIIRPNKKLPLPYQKYDTDAGYDLIYLGPEEKVIFRNETADLPVNCRMCIPEGMYGTVTGRSGFNKQGVLTHTGTIDALYTGVIRVFLTNLSRVPITVKPGERIAQIIFSPDFTVEFEEVSELPETPRGDNGFGSTGR